MIVLGASRHSLLSFSTPMLLSQNFCRNCQNLQGTMNSTPGTSEVGSINRISVSPKRGHLFRGTVLGLLLHSLNFSFSSLFQGKRVNYMIYLYHDPCVVFSMAFSVGGIWFYSLWQMLVNSSPIHVTPLTSPLKAKLCLILCDPMDGCPPGSFVHGTFQARILEWVAVSFSRLSSWPRD